MSAARTTICRRCVLTAAVPGITFDASGLCNICQHTAPAPELAEKRRRSKAEMTEAIAQLRGARPYDCVVAFSGGKDSSFVLKMLVETYRLSCLALTIDNGFLSADTAGNCRAVCGSLGVDHVMFAPKREFMTRMYRESALDESMHPRAAVQRASSICNSCITLINTHVLRVALQQGAPIIAGGYIGGQLPRDSALLRLHLGARSKAGNDAVERFVGHFGEEARRYFELESDVRKREIVVINPLLGLSLSEQEIIAAITPLGWTHPKDTGLTSTNCRLNDLGVYAHSRRHGFHPYIFETADQVRHGLLDRDKALDKLSLIPSFDDVAWLASRIGVGHNDI